MVNRGMNPLPGFQTCTDGLQWSQPGSADSSGTKLGLAQVHWSKGEQAGFKPGIKAPIREGKVARQPAGVAASKRAKEARSSSWRSRLGIGVKGVG
ncbi:hypothetical protein ASPCADRAFT_209275 [Aspergillus carbonarius ITEM 5010]|uniref:Uncharacterized protein n=1 Tax=Aspergillus carbonarius (strain ITEM 5010) TaxID=602072 RepID=A0A1R3RFQ9_ASPC5|nr:hypothetical protein ASPCADRAFT_209275 [Aspergillus carbonarius ITEM 5010]